MIRTDSAIGQVFNLGSNEEITISKLSERVRQIAGSQSPITYVPYEKAYEAGFEDMQRRIPCLEKIGRFIDYRPKTLLHEIIEKVVEFERSNRLQPVAYEVVSAS